MAHLRLATWNVEWFNALFDSADRLLADGEWSARYRVTRGAQADAIAHVLKAMDPDGVMIVEAPDSNLRRSTVRALQNFAAAYGLRCRAAVSGFANDTQQEIAFLFDPGRLRAEHAPRGGGAGELGQGPAPAFDRSVRIDLDSDGTPESVTFSKPPLELAVSAGERALRIVGVHIKSKAPNGAKSDGDIIRVAVENRRKQLAQCLWLRARLVEDLKAGEDVVVMGDFNDGPGLDEWETLFGQSGVEIVMGEAGEFRLYDPHARLALMRRGAAQPATARFLIPDAEAGGRRWLSALLDYIMISPGLRACRPRWRIWHPFDDPESYADAALRDALLTASDHFPVTLDLEL